MIAIAPTATIASIAGCYECIEPQVSNLFKRETLSGEFMQINRYLVRNSSAWIVGPEMIGDVKPAEGSIQGIDGIPDDLKAIYRTAWEIPMQSLIDMAADRGAFIDQSQSLNLFMEAPTIGKLSLDVHVRVEGRPQDHLLPAQPSGHPDQPGHCRWLRGGPTGGPDGAPKTTFTDEEAVACSLENPESCEACD